MKHEVRGIVQGNADSRSAEFLDPEPSAEDEPNVSLLPHGGYERAGAPIGMTPEEVEQRSRLGRFIPMKSLPGDRAGLIAGARDLDAPDDIIGQLSALPEGERYETVSQIWQALGHHNEERRV
jgi:hypothetical protein